MDSPRNPMNFKRIVLFTLLAAASAAALAQSSRRERESEIYIGPVFTDGKNFSFDGGTQVRTNTGYGLTIGYGYNFDRHLAAGIEAAWSDQDYRATVNPGAGNPNGPGTLNGTIETGTLRFYGTWNIMKGEFTPFITGGAGWTYIDTNVPNGLPESYCWYYPWWGGYCSYYQPTKSTTRFSYNLAAGLRWDIGRAVLRGTVSQQWMDFGGSYG